MYLLDTCAWLDLFTAPDRMGARFSQLIEREQSLSLSAISPWEVSLKFSKGNLWLQSNLDDWIRRALPIEHIHLLPLTPEIAIESTRLPGTFPKDRADSLIVATARVHGLSIITSDQRLLDYPHVKSLDSRH